MAPKLSLLLASALLVAPLCPAQEPPTPVIEGYITFTDGSSFDVNGHHILTGPRTAAQILPNTYSSIGIMRELAPFLGERAAIFGTMNYKTHSIDTDRIVLDPRKPGEIEGEGMIDWVKPAAGPDQLIRADGYQVLVTPKTKTTFRPPLTTGAPLQANMWLAFKGRQRPDGVVVAEAAVFIQNTINKSESKLLDKTDYDPDSVDSDAKQGGFSKFIKGLDPKQIPPCDDPAMQARITSIGDRLVPKYQRDLPESDLTKIIFRFQLVDQKDLHTPLSLPSGIILVPRKFVERMANDSQLAAVLAVRIAQAIEKQSWHIRQDFKVSASAIAAGEVVGAFIPGVNLLAILGTTGTNVHLEHQREDQVSRASLWLLHDAGFDITEAPRAWWLLNGKEGKDPSQIKLPRRTGVLYDQFATTWRQTVSPNAH